MLLLEVTKLFVLSNILKMAVISRDKKNVPIVI